VVGSTNSTNFSATTGAFQAASGGGFDAFVTKIALIALSPAEQIDGSESSSQMETVFQVQPLTQPF
jgi:hypothetical protein